MLVNESTKANNEIITEIARAFWENEGSIATKGNLIGEI